MLQVAIGYGKEPNLAKAFTGHYVLNQEHLESLTELKVSPRTMARVAECAERRWVRTVDESPALYQCPRSPAS